MAINTYFKNSVIRLTVAITQFQGGSPIDPTTLNLQVIDPAGNTTSQSFPGGIIKDSQGNYHFDYSTTTVAGDYAYRWFGTGTAQGALEGVFNVQPSRF